MYHNFSWEYVIYGAYLASDNPHLFTAKNVDRWGRWQLPTGLYEMRHLMAGKTKPKGKPSYDTNITWVNATLSDEDVAAIEQWDMSDGELFAGLMELQVTGHSVSGKKATDGVGFTCFAIGIDPDGDNAGLGLSGYGSDPRDAAIALLYKHFIKHQGVWPRAEVGGQRRFR